MNGYAAQISVLCFVIAMFATALFLFHDSLLYRICALEEEINKLRRDLRADRSLLESKETDA